MRWRRGQTTGVGGARLLVAALRGRLRDIVQISAASLYPYVPVSVRGKEAPMVPACPGSPQDGTDL